MSDLELAQVEIEQRSYISKVFAWMSAALVMTGIIAYVAASSEQLMNVFLSNNILFFGLLIAELLLVFSLAGLIKKMSATMATFIFFLYAALNGLTFSTIFYIFTMGSIATTFYITAGTFGIMAVFGYTTKIDLTSIGHLCLMALIGIIIASVVNIFFSNNTLYLITSIVGVIIFTLLTAYDVQKIKKLNVIGNEGTPEDTKESIIGALTLYLDFINLFLFLLRFTGRRR